MYPPFLLTLNESGLTLHLDPELVIAFGALASLGVIGKIVYDTFKGD